MELTGKISARIFHIDANIFELSEQTLQHIQAISEGRSLFGSIAPAFQH